MVRIQDLREVAKDVEVPPNRDGTMNVPLPNLAAGKYYIQVFTSAERNQDTLYELTLNH